MPLVANTSGTGSYFYPTMGRANIGIVAVGDSRYTLLSSSIEQAVTGSFAVVGQICPSFSTVVVSASQTAATINFNNGNFQELSLTGSNQASVIVTLSNIRAGSSYSVAVVQGATPTVPAFSSSLGAVIYSSGTLPTWSTANSERDLLSLMCDGVRIYGVVSTQFRNP